MSARGSLRRAVRVALSIRVVAPLALATCASGCRACASNEAVVAELVDVQGAAMRSGPADGAAWGTASKGATFALGDAVRTEAASTAKVELAAGGALRLSEKTVVRFLGVADQHDLGCGHGGLRSRG